MKDEQSLELVLQRHQKSLDVTRWYRRLLGYRFAPMLIRDIVNREHLVCNSAQPMFLASWALLIAVLFALLFT